MNQLLLKALHRVISDATSGDAKIRESGNVTAQIKKRDLDAVLAICDKYYEIPLTGSNAHLDVFEFGLDLGRNAKQRPVLRVKLPNYAIYFVGTEADVLRKLDEIPEIGQTTPSS